MLQAAVGAGVDVCFANPGTTEVHLLGALDRTPGIRSVLGLFEGVCTGAADGFARMSGRPAMTLLHLGPGLANGAANLHNARKAASPVVNVVGTHANRHLNQDSLLSSDVSGLAQYFSLFVRETRASDDAAADFQLAYAAAVEGRGVSTVVFPTDVQWGEVTRSQPHRCREPWAAGFDAGRVEQAARELAKDNAVLIVDGAGLSREGLVAAGRIRAATGCRVFSKRQPARMESGPGVPVIERLGYFPDAAIAQLTGASTVVLAGLDEPVAIFAYQGGPSHVIPDETVVFPAARVTDDVVGALQAIAEIVDAKGKVAAEPAKPVDNGLSALIADVLPEGAIYVDEAITSAPDVFEHAVGRKEFTYLGLTGGSIGIGGPLATGAAVACGPERPVVNVQGDGSALYTLQALWTQAREELNVTTVICANHRYQILSVEQQRAGITGVSPEVEALMDLRSPEIDWVNLSHGFGVPAVRVSPEELPAAMKRAVAEDGPALIQLDIPAERK